MYNARLALLASLVALESPNGGIRAMGEALVWLASIQICTETGGDGGGGGKGGGFRTWP